MEVTLGAFPDLLRSTGGDFTKSDGTGSFSIYGDKFPVSLSNLWLHPIADPDMRPRMRILPRNTPHPAFCQW